MLLQKIFFLNKDKYSISTNEIEDLFDIEEQKKDVIIYQKIINRYDSVLKNKFESLYIESKKIKNVVYNFLKLLLFKKSINSGIEMDLYMNNLQDFNEKFTITVKEKKTIYKFRVSDIVNLWVSALQNCDQLFSKPLNVKNPYTNIIFSKTTLYNIYFKLLDTGFIIPNIINSFVNCELDIDDFSIKEFPYLKENAIKFFVTEGHVLDKYEQTINMLHDYRKTVYYYTASSLCSTRSKIRIVKTFKLHLYLYLRSKYSCNPLVRDTCKNKLKTHLRKLIEEKPYFGLTSSEIVKFVPISERTSSYRSSRMSPTPLSTSNRSTTTLRRRRPTARPPPPPQRISLTNVTSNRPVLNIPPPPPLSSALPSLMLPPPPPPTTTPPSIRYAPPPIISYRSPSQSTLPRLQLNNFTRRESIITPRYRSVNETTVNRIIDSINTTSVTINDLIENNNRASNIIDQISDIIEQRDEDVSETPVTDISLESDDDISNDLTEPEEGNDVEEDEYSNEFEYTISLDIHNPFMPRNELNRTPPPENESEMREPLLNNSEAQNIINRLDTIINLHRDQNNTTHTD